MKLADLTEYVEKRYNIKEIHKWASFPSFSVLSDTTTGKWVALLMRQYDYETGTEYECCDLKCSDSALSELSKPYLREAFRMKGKDWIGINFDSTTENDVICSLFDKAIEQGRIQGSTVIIEAQKGNTEYRDTPILSHEQTEEENVPPRIMEMKKLYRYSQSSLFEEKCMNFYIQGKAMEDYEDDAMLPGPFKHYYPTYHDLDTAELRGYFSWRTRIRKKQYIPISPSFAYMYIYEIINGIGVESAEAGLEAIREFEKNFIANGYGNKGMENNIHRWLFDYAVINNLPSDVAMEYAKAEEVLYAEAIDPLLRCESSDEEIIKALCTFCYKSFLSSPVTKSDEGIHIIAQSWRYAISAEPSFVIRMFRSPMKYPWFPMENAVYYFDRTLPDMTYKLYSSIYHRENGRWNVRRYMPSAFNKRFFSAFIHEADKVLRKYLHLGHPLKDKSDDALAEKYIKAAIAAYEMEKKEEAKPKTDFSLMNLERIREESLIIRDSLLTEEEVQDDEAPSHPDNDNKSKISYTQILKILLAGKSPESYMQKYHLLPSVVADAINEAYFDEIGDSIVQSDGKTLELVDDYADDVRAIIGGRDG
ncbi:MAG: TerB N-terminal domain-containing protein [Spirochaetes bacterium]|uniref:TerB N-terminal domain-containing protein n=1 Tax=Candidatus Ornithospirochaeta stercoripullorum TaxID=2840899 RepID=A0A9D9E0U5_9SPIO|nr:TerB N-terminal domain-containing protein [Candidatus Ornithospirochaeta stercoripullorum]